MHPCHARPSLPVPKSQIRPHLTYKTWDYMILLLFLWGCFNRTLSIYAALWSNSAFQFSNYLAFRFSNYSALRTSSVRYQRIYTEILSYLPGILKFNCTVLQLRLLRCQIFEIFKLLTCYRQPAKCVTIILDNHRISIKISPATGIACFV